MVEFALVVDHEYQSHGIGTMLLTRLVDAARAHGIDRMTAEVLAQNTLMLEVIRDRGWAPDVAATTRHNIAAAERRILLDAARSDLRTSADGDRRGGTR
ncbi:GNAT superfamily N-acetyltransferase [Rhodococcus opacus]|nr:GNAT family N-acetyltransferase [Rhodococcus opacus]MDH6291016.1 GNAT superfamily N-acetyltransferase [Rhodococcus opacus]